MPSSAKQIREYSGPPILSFGFRPFFLAGAIVAIVVPSVIALSYCRIWNPNFAGNIIAWHGHEMVYGYLTAVIAGFILTAVPNWTGRLPIVGEGLAALTALWILGRVSVLFVGGLGGIIAAVIDSSFLFLLSALLWREIFAGKNWRNAPVCILIFGLGVGNVIWHYNTLHDANGYFGLRLGLAIIAVLIGLIGGRIIPSFTRNWFAKTGKQVTVASFSNFDKVSLGILSLSLVLWLMSPLMTVTGYLLIFAGTINFIRLLRWNGRYSFKEPLVLILHIGYLWLSLSILLLGISTLAPTTISETSALHALTAGAMGVMTLAVMTRATRGHTGHPLSSDTMTNLIYALVNIGAILRVVAPFMPENYGAVLLISTLFWSGAFLLFSMIYGRYLFSKRVSNP